MHDTAFNHKLNKLLLAVSMHDSNTDTGHCRWVVYATFASCVYFYCFGYRKVQPYVLSALIWQVPSFFVVGDRRRHFLQYDKNLDTFSSHFDQHYNQKPTPRKRCEIIKFRIFSTVNPVGSTNIQIISPCTS